MLEKIKKAKYPLLAIFLVLFVDQVIKIYVKTHFISGEEYRVAGKWFRIHFTENPGMAFGMEFGGDYGKLTLSIFRIIAALFGIYYIRQLLKTNQHIGYITCVGLIFAGAVGNIIDSMFYGLIFNDSEFQVAQFMPSEGGYAGFLHGHVVDMFYFPIIDGVFPSWVPFWGGEPFEFFRPVFNLADASISFGVLFILIFQKRFFKKKPEHNEHPDSDEKKNESDELNSTSSTQI
jgi:signal peptidase II